MVKNKGKEEEGRRGSEKEGGRKKKGEVVRVRGRVVRMRWGVEKKGREDRVSLTTEVSKDTSNSPYLFGHVTIFRRISNVCGKAFKSNKLSKVRWLAVSCIKSLGAPGPWKSRTVQTPGLLGTPHRPCSGSQPPKASNLWDRSGYGAHGLWELPKIPASRNSPILEALRALSISGQFHAPESSEVLAVLPLEVYLTIEK
ncbi:hypothetical protein J6590_076602 [Homalodisca vitripennis]|nr:hypothetical protein J6590_076602 [Homalodisca vitripennis]